MAPKTSMLRTVLFKKGRFFVLFFFSVLAFLSYWFLLPVGVSRRLPKEADLTVVHLTDLHLSSRGGVTATPWTHKIVIDGYKLHRTCTGKSLDLLAQAVAVINGKIKPDVVVITGDIVDSGDDVEALEKGATILRRLNCPVIIAKGDHDPAGTDANTGRWMPALGPLDGVTNVNGVDFFYIPFESDGGTFKRLADSISGAQGKNQPKFLCLHRMLYASWLMQAFSKRTYGSQLLSPDRETILEVLGKSSDRWLVLCGHSHTNYETTRGNITEFCTSSLAEYPHELRILKVKGGDVRTAVVRLDEVGDE